MAIAVRTILEVTGGTVIREVVFCCYDEAAVDVYRQVLQANAPGNHDNIPL